MLADGGDCLSDPRAVRDQGALFGRVASDSTAFRLIEKIACTPGLLDALDGAHGRARGHVWKLAGPPGRVTIDLDATLLTSRSEKDGAAGNYKGDYGFHPMLACCDQTRKARAAMLRPGNAGANSAADQLTVAEIALAQIQGGAWVTAVDQDGSERANGQVTELADLVDQDIAVLECHRRARARLRIGSATTSRPDLANLPFLEHNRVWLSLAEARPDRARPARLDAEPAADWRDRQSRSQTVALPAAAHRRPAREACPNTSTDRTRQRPQHPKTRHHKPNHNNSPPLTTSAATNTHTTSLDAQSGLATASVG